MTVTTTWTLLPESVATPAEPDAIPTTLPRASLEERASLGFGLLRPWRRDQQRDFDHDGGARLVAACVGQVIGTAAAGGRSYGELPWRPEFGSRLHLLRFRGNTPVMREMARSWISAALARWEPRAKLRDVEVIEGYGGEVAERTLALRIRFDVRDRQSPANAVVLANLTATLPLL